MTRLAAAFRSQARATETLGSPFMGRLMRLFSQRLDPGHPLGARLFAWPGDVSAMGDSVPLRLAGALHGLVLDGTAPGLAAVYPPHEASDDLLWDTVLWAMETHRDRIDTWLNSPPQTNEVRRAAAMIAVANLLTAQDGLPLRISELGASAGLNLMFDRFGLDLGAQRYGPSDPVLTLVPEWTGAPPPVAPITVLERRGADLIPLDPQADHLRLTAYLWPDQPERLARTRAAISVAEAQVDQADAADWLETRLAEPHPGARHLLYHTIAWQYFPAQVQARCTALIAAAGARATPDSPLAWLGMEADDQTPGAGLRLRIWPGDHAIDLGRIDFHGRWVDWRLKQATLGT